MFPTTMSPVLIDRGHISGEQRQEQNRTRLCTKTRDGDAEHDREENYEKHDGHVRTHDEVAAQDVVDDVCFTDRVIATSIAIVMPAPLPLVSFIVLLNGNKSTNPRHQIPNKLKGQEKESERVGTLDSGIQQVLQICDSVLAHVTPFPGSSRAFRGTAEGGRFAPAWRFRIAISPKNSPFSSAVDRRCLFPSLRNDYPP